MALLFIEGWDTDTTVAADGRWTGGGTQTSVGSGGRTGNRLNLANASLARTVSHVFAPAGDVIIVGCAVMRTSDYTAAVLFQLREGATPHMDLRITATGQLTVTRNGTVLATTTFIPALGVWNYYELKVTIHDTAGTFELRINGNSVAEVSGTSQDTKNGGTGNLDTILLNDPGGSGTAFDDLYICDDAGSANNDFLGDVKVETLYPNGNGNSSQLVGSDGNSTDNYLLVDETTPNSDTDYVESATVGNKDTYAVTDLAAVGGTVYGVQLSPYARKNDAGARTICTVARLSGTEVDSANAALSTSYQHFVDMRETKPGGGAWTISDVNSAEFGVKVTA